ncbi:MAG: metal ABC transporter permease, partial [Lachnospiraceae bacterium]|nr:metal ABC transporter permease [Lachnospiraceae bacterium]
HGLGEVGFASLSLAVALSLPPLYVSIPVVIIASLIIMVISEKKGASGDVTIALVSTGALAFGIIITAITRGFNIDVYDYMFGSILSMGSSDVALSIGLSVLIIVMFAFFYNRLFLITCDEEFAKSIGINVTFYHFLVSLIVALVVVIGMKMIGTLLISSLIIFPAIISKKLTTSFKKLVMLSAIVSILCFVLGIFLSFFLKLPTGASIVAVNILLLLITNAYNFIENKFKI